MTERFLKAHPYDGDVRPVSYNALAGPDGRLSPEIDRALTALSRVVKGRLTAELLAHDKHLLLVNVAEGSELHAFFLKEFGKDGFALIKRVWDFFKSLALGAQLTAISA